MRKILNKEYSDGQFLTVAGIIVMLLMGWLVVRYDAKYKDAKLWEQEYKHDIVNVLKNEKDTTRKMEIIKRLKEQ
jgi:hypothetical protein